MHPSFMRSNSLALEIKQVTEDMGSLRRVASAHFAMRHRPASAFDRMVLRGRIRNRIAAVRLLRLRYRALLEAKSESDAEYQMAMEMRGALSDAAACC